ncbi:MAG: VWA domain-containing protein, partial [Cyanobacteria bacterium HKST-UBA01]|nr:VWA domain-containing protein [Cyanobacteria bacterium HKST-UBA01]
AEASIQEFLRQREGDRVGFIIFDKQAYYGWPLTDDLNVIRRFVKGLPNYVGSGTEFDGKKGAIQAAMTHFEERGQSKTKVIVMVTDGEGDIAAERIQAMASNLKSHNVKLYVIGIGYKKWEEVPETEDLRSLVKAVDGKIIEVLDVEQMRVAFAEINQLEKSTVVKEASLEQTDIAHWFMIFGLLSICVFGAFVVLTHDEL